jgi:hypothetical protein
MKKLLTLKISFERKKYIQSKIQGQILPHAKANIDVAV